MLWYAYASFNYTNPAGADLPPPLWDLDGELLWGPYRGTWTRFDDAPRLPRRAAYVSSGYLYKNLGEKYPAPFDSGFTNFTYEAQSITNLNGLLIPTKLSFIKWLPDGTVKNPFQLRPSFRAEFTVTSILDRCTVERWKPTIPKGLLVNDFRITTNPSVNWTNRVGMTYAFDGTHWKSLDEIMKMYRYHQSMEPLTSHSRVSIALVALVAVARTLVYGLFRMLSWFVQ